MLNRYFSIKEKSFQLKSVILSHFIMFSLFFFSTHLPPLWNIKFGQLSYLPTYKLLFYFRPYMISATTRWRCTAARRRCTAARRRCTAARRRCTAARRRYTAAIRRCTAARRRCTASRRRCTVPKRRCTALSKRCTVHRRRCLEL